MFQVGNDEGGKQLKKPCGIAMDKEFGIVAITDWSGDKVVLYSYQGKIIATTSGFKCPHSVAIDDDSRRVLITDSWNNQLKYFKYSNNQEK